MAEAPGRGREEMAASEAAAREAGQVAAEREAEGWVEAMGVGRKAAWVMVEVATGRRG